MQCFSRAEALVARAVDSDFIIDLRTPPPEGATAPIAYFMRANARLYNAARDNPKLLDDLAKLDLSRENPHLAKVIERVLRRLIPTDLELLSGLTTPDVLTDPSHFIQESIATLPRQCVRIPFASEHEVRHAHDKQRAAIEIKDYKIDARVCFLIGGLGENDCPNINVVIQSKERFLHAMYPGGRRTNLLFAWINNQPHDSLPEIVNSIATLNKWMLKNREINNTLGSSPRPIFLHRVRDPYPICLIAFSDLVSPDF
jgi:hypothetical protein